jgi:uncharacterized repeat protein (TIGR01451 family)
MASALDPGDNPVTDDDTLTINLGSTTAIDLAKKSDATAMTGVDDTIIYTYAVTNIGTDPLADVSVTDPQAGLSPIDCGGVTVEPQIASLDSGNTVNCTATYTVLQADDDTGSITNTGTATAATISDSDDLTITLGATASIDIAKSSDVTDMTGEGDTITYTYTVTNSGDDALKDVSVTDSQTNLSPIECGELAFIQHDITLSASRAAAVIGIDVDADGDIDVVSASRGDNTIAWYQSDLFDDAIVVRPPFFTERIITTNATDTQTVAVADVGESPGGVVEALDIISGFLFEIAWHEGHVAEVCTGFDVTGDKEMDGEELSLMGAAFTESCLPPNPPNPWWLGLDYTGDCLIDGNDLAILASSGVWGNVTEDDPDKTLCSFTCP